MVILKKDFETKEIQIPGFRKILKNTKHPDYKELRVYIKNGWIPIDPEDDDKEIQKAKKRKQVARDNKARRPKYIEMEKNLQKQINNKKLDPKILEEFKERKGIKNNYQKVLKWYNEEISKIPNETNNKTQKDEKETKNDKK